MHEQIFRVLFNIQDLHSFAPAVVVFFAAHLPYVLLAGLLLYLLFYRDISFKKRLFVVLGVFVSAGLAYGVTLSIRGVYEVGRPFVALPNVTPLIDASERSLESFPSAHATFFFALGMFLFFYHKRLGLLYLAGALLVGLARVAAGIHWPLDILAGAVVGVLGAVLVYWLTQSIKRNL